MAKILRNLEKLILTGSIISALNFNSFAQQSQKIEHALKDSPKTEYTSEEKIAFLSVSTKMDYNNYKLKEIAESITNDCPLQDKECKISKIFNYVTNNFKYIDDPDSLNGMKSVFSPYETIKREGGDCEDLSILNNS